MSLNRKKTDTAAPKGGAWKKNLIFVLVILMLAAALYFGVRAAHSGKGTGLQAVVDFGGGVSETLSLDKDYDYLYDVGDYVVHLQVKDGARTMCASNSAGFPKKVPGRPASLRGCMWSWRPPQNKIVFWGSAPGDRGAALFVV